MTPSFPSRILWYLAHSPNICFIPECFKGLFSSCFRISLIRSLVPLGRRLRYFAACRWTIGIICPFNGQTYRRHTGTGATRRKTPAKRPKFIQKGLCRSINRPGIRNYRCPQPPGRRAYTKQGRYPNHITA